MKALRIHPNPFVTAGFLAAFLLLVGFLYGAPMITSQADEGDKTGDNDERSPECLQDPYHCSCTSTCPTSAPPPPPTQCTNPHECTQPTPEPTPIDCNGPFHPSCYTTTPIPTPDPTTPPPTTPPPTTPPPTTPPPTTTRPPTTTLPPIPNPFAAPSGLTGSANCNDATCDITLRWNSNSSVSQWTAHRQTGPSASDWTLVGHVSANTISESGLACGPTYRFRVYGLRNSASRDSVASPIYSFTSVPAACPPPPPTAFPTPTPTNLAPAPTSITISDATETTLKVKWSRVSVDYFYKIEKKKAGGSWGLLDDDVEELTFTATGLDCNSYYYFRVSTKGTGTPHSSTDYGPTSTEESLKTLPCPVTPPPSTTNPTPTTTPNPAFAGSVSESSGGPIAQWVFWRNEVILTIVDASGNHPTADYEFWLHTNLNSTGLQLDNLSGDCQWTGTPSQELPWQTATSPLSFNVIRCGVGDPNNTGFSLFMREVAAPDVQTDLTGTGRIEQPYHFDKAEATYRPLNSNSNITSTDPLYDVTNYDKAADAWNNALISSTPGLEFTPSNRLDSDIIVATFSSTATPNPCGSFACVLPTSYPHIGNRIKLMLMDRPINGGIQKDWTDDYIEFANDTMNRFEYLPGTLMHEFGHNLGLWHSTAPNTIMWEEYDPQGREVPPCITAVGAAAHRCGLAQNDISGARAIYD